MKSIQTRRQPKDSLTSRARRLRRDSTDAEKLLWSHLRASQLAGFKFRRQSPIGLYIADFECYAANLVIELDGGQHQEQQCHDAERTKYLQASGYRVLRFWNNEVLAHTDAVLQTILNALEAWRGQRSKKVPSPRGRGLG